MRAGELNLRMTIQTRTVTVDPANGQQLDTFADGGKIWVGREFTSGAEVLAGGVERSKQTLEFWAHYASAKNLTTKHRLTDASGVVFEVLSVDLGNRKGAVVISVETGVAGG